jgi:hypothetical protein
LKANYEESFLKMKLRLHMSELIEALKVAEVRKDYQAGAGELGVIYLDCIEDAHLVLEAARKWNTRADKITELEESTMSEMPENIWAYYDPLGGYGGHWFGGPAPVDDGSDTVKYTRADKTAELERQNGVLREALADIIKGIRHKRGGI